MLLDQGNLYELINIQRRFNLQQFAKSHIYVPTNTAYATTGLQLLANSQCQVQQNPGNE